MKTNILALNNFFYTYIHKTKINKKATTLLQDLSSRMLVTRMQDHEMSIPALRLAVNGAEKIIRTTTAAIRDELEHHKNHNIFEWENSNFLSENLKEVSFQKIISFLQNASKYFKQYEKWPDWRFGGDNWHKITDTLINVTKSYIEYLQAKNTLKEFEKGKKTLMYLSIFDQLAHNTNSIYDKLLKYDNSKLQEYETENFENELNKIINLRHVSESHLDSQVLKEIIKNLEIKLPYKDLISKLKINPKENYENYDLLQDDVTKIENRKIIKGFVNNILGMYKYTIGHIDQRLNINDVLLSPQQDIFYAIIKNINITFKYSLFKYLIEDINAFISLYPDDMSINYETLKKIEILEFCTLNTYEDLLNDTTYSIQNVDSIDNIDVLKIKHPNRIIQKNIQKNIQEDYEDYKNQIREEEVSYIRLLNDYKKEIQEYIKRLSEIERNI